MYTSCIIGVVALYTKQWQSPFLNVIDIMHYPSLLFSFTSMYVFFVQCVYHLPIWQSVPHPPSPNATTNTQARIERKPPDGCDPRLSTVTNLVLNLPRRLPRASDCADISAICERTRICPTLPRD
ncbi:hypothetical protein K504DRAFT_255025 [Pleomassaria siparia CBS 279.74]|uniref:Uncharacterized protein n=1 Tax=Pleomassaria siparia CBS 279.74 TaxID=1314801 RepID=A0A6G1KBU0_9PLEO|nr:hypothetical protein K504DRAFT_255025 [Pleomassaria siparia CBS 279.74]